MVKVLIVGAGIVGLSTALQLKRRRPDISIKIVADKFLKDTTSYGAGGLFRPNALLTPGVPESVLSRLLRNRSFLVIKIRKQYILFSLPSINHFRILRLGNGAKTRSSSTPVWPSQSCRLSLEPWCHLATCFRMNLLWYGYQVTTVILDQTRYMPWLMKQVQSEGVEFENRTVKSLEEFVGLYDVVVNCGGFRAGQLAGDDTVYPVRGQMVMVEAPWIKHWVYTEDLAFFIPKHDGHTIGLGGTRQKGRYDVELDPNDRQDILDRCYKLWPSLKHAQITGEWADLRPHRVPIRVEKETRCYDNGPLEVVHNYCHGSNGIALSWGSSTNAVNLILDAVKNKQKL